MCVHAYLRAPTARTALCSALFGRGHKGAAQILPNERVSRQRLPFFWDELTWSDGLLVGFAMGQYISKYNGIELKKRINCLFVSKMMVGRGPLIDENVY